MITAKLTVGSRIIEEHGYVVWTVVKIDEGVVHLEQNLPEPPAMTVKGDLCWPKGYAGAPEHMR